MKARLTARKAWRVLAVVAVAAWLAACNQKIVAEHPPEPGDKAVARVNGATVWASDVKREAVAQGLIGKGEPLDVSSDLFRQILEQVEDQKLLAAEAASRHLDRDPETQRRIAAARERVLVDAVLETVVGKAINEDSITGLYQEMLKYQTPAEELRLRQIIVATQPEADQIRKALLAGGSFDALAAERSKDETTRFKGGAMPPLTSDMLPEGYAAALRDAKAGQIVGPFRTAEGWVVARVDERKIEAPISLDAARPQIVRFITDDQVKDLILDLRHKAKVETLIPTPLDVPGAPREPASAPPVAAAPAAAAPAGAAGVLKPAQEAKP